MRGEPKNRPKYHKLRIAFAAVCGALGLLLIALWVRSYSWHDAAGRIQSSRAVMAASVQGRISIYSQQLGVDDQWRFVSTPVQHPETSRLFNVPRWYNRYPSYIGLAIPHWLPILVLFALGTLACRREFKSQFSLRTLLIVGTLIAVGLGLIVVVSR
jgi:hypothetical protein